MVLVTIGAGGVAFLCGVWDLKFVVLLFGFQRRIDSFKVVCGRFLMVDPVLDMGYEHFGLKDLLLDGPVHEIALFLPGLVG